MLTLSLSLKNHPLCRKGLYLCHRDTTGLFKQIIVLLFVGGFVGFFRPHLFPEVVADVFPVSEHHKCGAVQGFQKLCTAKSHSLPNTNTERSLTQMKMPPESDLLSDSWLTQSQEHLQTGKKKRRELGWFNLCPHIPMILCLLLHFVTQSHLRKCYNKGALMPSSSYFCITGL